MRGVYAGSFDPVTYGHLDIIERAMPLCDELIVAVANNVRKTGTFTIDEKMDFLREVTHKFDNVTVTSFNGLLIDYMRESGARVAIRGLRVMSDFEMEFQMAHINKKLYPEMETVFLVTSNKYSFLSSSTIKEVASFGGCVDAFVPPIVEEGLRQKFQSK